MPEGTLHKTRLPSYFAHLPVPSPYHDHRPSPIHPSAISQLSPYPITSHSAGLTLSWLVFPPTANHGASNRSKLYGPPSAPHPGHASTMVASTVRPSGLYSLTRFPQYDFQLGTLMSSETMSEFGSLTWYASMRPGLEHAP